MTGYFNNLSEQLFQKPLQECSLEEVESLARKYPYFAPAQFLLLKKLNHNSEEYRDQYQRSILYYKNPLEFDYFIQNEHYQTHFEESGAEENWNNGIEHQDEIKEEVTAHDPVSETEQAKEINEINDVIDIAPQLEQQEEITEKEIAAEEPIVATEETQIASEILNEEAEVKNEPEEKKSEEPPAEMAFEPYHTVDYFASQGIKLSQEEATNDRFGKQLKSFTEWLKTMKRFPQPETVKKVSEPVVEKVADLAEHSVKNPEVVTVAMAEVWEKQGNSEKATEVYRKLSLLNPSKSAYFAAKIDNLKKEN